MSQAFLVPALDFADTAGTPWNPGTLVPGPLQRFLDEDPTYYGSTVAGYPVFTPEEAYTSIAQPRSGRCWLFDGSNDYGEIAGSGGMIAPNMSFGGWFKFAHADFNYALIAKGTNEQWQLFIAGGFITLQCGGSAGLSFPTTGVSGWNHWFATVNGTTGKIYRNGAEVVSGPVLAMPSANTSLVRIGLHTTGVWAFGGSLKDILIDDEAYTAGEVLSLFNTHQIPAGKSPLAFYRCEEESGTIGYNSLVNSNHLTLTNITQSTFHALDTGVQFSDANERGHTVAILSQASAQLLSPTIAGAGTSGSLVFHLSFANASTLQYFYQQGNDLTLALKANGKLQLATWMGASEFPSAQVLTANTTYSIAVVWNTVNVEAFVDGVSQGTIAYTQGIVNSGGGFYFASRAAASIGFIGTLYSGRWYSTRLSAGQASIANWPTTNQVSRWDNFDSATVVRDRVGSNHLTATGITNVVIPRSVATPTQDVAGNTLGVTGPVAKLATAEVRCVTGDGSAVYGSATLAVGTTLTICARVRFAATGTQAIIAVNGSAGNGVLLRYDGNTTIQWFSNTGNAVQNITVPSLVGSWHHVAITHTGSNYAFYLNGALISSGTLGPLWVAGNEVAVGRYNSSGGINYLNGSISDVRIYSDVKTQSEIQAIRDGFDNRTNIVAHWPIQEGPGTANTNRTSYDTVGTNHITWNNGTVSTIWANYCPFARDWCVENGGGIAANGAFIPGRIGSGLDAAGNTKTLVSGKHGNPYSRIAPNIWNMPSLVIRGVDSTDKLVPSATYESLTTATDDAFNRIKADGSDRYFLTPAALTGADLTNADGYVA